MTWKSAFTFRILIGLIFLAQYFLGYDLQGNNKGNFSFLLLGIVFAGYGFFGFFQKWKLKKARGALDKKKITIKDGKIVLKDKDSGIIQD